MAFLEVQDRKLCLMYEGVCGNGIIDDPRVARLLARLGGKVGTSFETIYKSTYLDFLAYQRREHIPYETLHGKA
jgi:hypothetical protein